jgi:hypothetical protein
MYAGIFLHLGGAISATVIMQMASAIPVKGRQIALTNRDSLPHKTYFKSEDVPIALLQSSGEAELLAEWGLRGKFKLTAYHMVACFVLGLISALISVVLWVWSSEVQKHALGGSLLPVALVAAFTFLFAFLW